jgi:ribosomal protein S18 acetylase RimI-like enzyme
MSGSPGWSIRALGPADLPAFRVMRLDALRLHPRAYGSSYEEEIEYTPDDFAARWPAPPGVVLGAFADERLIGFTGLQVSEKIKQRHKGFVYSVYVDAAFRRLGVADGLMAAAIAAARDAGLRYVWLTVAADNENARRLYQRLGFRRFGTEPRGLLVDGAFVDEDMMVLDLD